MHSVLTITHLRNIFQSWKVHYKGETLDLQPTWSIPASLDHGVLTTNIAFVLAKTLRVNPSELAVDLSKDLENFVIRSELLLNYNKNNIKIKNIGAYINICLEDSFLVNCMKNSKNNTLLQLEEKFVLDYIGANVAKRLHAGHMRVCNIGDSLRRVLSLKYKNLVTDNHWGDWGINMGILIWGWKNFDHTTFDKESELIDRLSTIYIWSNSQKDNIENWDNLVREEFFKLEQGDKTNHELWQKFIMTTKADLQQDLDIMNVPPLQIEQGESFYEKDMQSLTTFMEENNIWEREGKARYFDFEKLAEIWIGIDSDYKKIVSKLGRSYLISSGGYTSYCYRDVATKFQYARDLKVDKSLVVTDKTQKHNFDQAFTIINYLSTLPKFEQQFGDNVCQRLNLNNMNHLGFGFLSLSSGKMSSRKGNILLLRDLVRQVGDKAKQNILQKHPDLDQKELKKRCQKIALAAIKWHDLKQSYEQDITLDIEQILKFEGNTGVYQLYTFVRLNSVFSKLGSKTSLDDKITTDWSILDIERQILQQIYILPDVLEQICIKYQPHLLCNYLYQLTNLINKWYNDVPILKDTQRQGFLIQFVTQCMSNIEFCLDLLGIEVLEEM